MGGLCECYAKRSGFSRAQRRALKSSEPLQWQCDVDTLLDCGMVFLKTDEARR